MSGVAIPVARPLVGRFDALLDGALAEGQARALLTAAPDVAAITELVLALRARMVPVRTPASAIDVCGTGGDGHHTRNISTAVALVVAACGVPVAKHGNRAASSLAGGADTLEALGLDLARASSTAEASLGDLGIAFLFAQAHHPALVPLAQLRRAIGQRTLLNLTGPLCNPAGVRRQLIGVADLSTFDLFAQVPWADLGMERVMVVCGEEGLDEISIAGPTRVFAHGFAAPKRIVPEDAGLPRHALAAIRGGDAGDNAAALRRLLQGEAGAYRDAVVLNAAAALIVAGEATDLRGGAEEAAEVIDKGLANTLLDCWIAFRG